MHRDETAACQAERASLSDQSWLLTQIQMVAAYRSGSSPKPRALLSTDLGGTWPMACDWLLLIRRHLGWTILRRPWPWRWDNADRRLCHSGGSQLGPRPRSITAPHQRPSTAWQAAGPAARSRSTVGGPPALGVAALSAGAGG